MSALCYSNEFRLRNLCNRNDNSCLDARLSKSDVLCQVLTFWQIAKKQNGQKGRVSSKVFLETHYWLTSEAGRLYRLEFSVTTF